MFSNTETLKANEQQKRRILRIQQVREQSKNIAKKIRSKVSEEKNKIALSSEVSKQQKLNTFKRKTIDHLRSNLDGRLNVIGTSHTAAAIEEIENNEWAAQKEVNRLKALERGEIASSILSQSSGRRKAGRIAQSKKPTAVILHHPPDNVKKPSDKVHFYSEDVEQGSLCSNQIPQCDINPQLLNPSSKTFDIIREEIPESDSRDNFIPSPHKGVHCVSDLINKDLNDPETEIDRDVNPENTEGDSTLKFTPVETIRQLTLSAENTNNQTDANINPIQTPDGQDNIAKEAADSGGKESNRNLHAMSRDNPFTTAISDHIKNRKLNLNKSVQNKAVLCQENDESDDICAMRDLIQHTRYAPCGFTNKTPLIPSLPKNYKKSNEKDWEGKFAGRKKSVLQAATDDWLPTNKNAIQRECVPGCRCPASVSYGRKSSLKGTEHIQGSKQYSHTVKYKPDILQGKCFSSDHSPVKKCTAVGFKDNTQSVICYDQSNKFEKNVFVNPECLVERLPKEGKSAFELAREEINEESRYTMEMNDFCKEEARRIRGIRAMEKERRERNRRKVASEKVPIKDWHHVGDDNESIESDSDEEVDSRDAVEYIDKPSEDLEKKTKVIRHSVPVPATVVQPEHKKYRERNKQPDLHPVIKSNELPADKLMAKERDPKKTVLYTNVSKHNSLSNLHNDDDLDEVPTRDSDSTARSVIQSSHKDYTMDPMHVNRVLNLVEKQRSQLLKEVARLGYLMRTDKSRTPKKMARVHKPTERMEHSDSTTDERAPIVVEKKKHKKTGTTPPKSKPCNTEMVTKDQKLTNDKMILSQDPNQISTSNSSSISFQGLQIVIEVKKGSKSNTKATLVQTEENVQTVTSQHESQDSSTEMSIKTSKVVTTKEVIVGNENNSRLRFDSSTSTSYMSPPEKFSSRAIETLLGKQRIPSKSSQTQTDLPVTNIFSSRNRREKISNSSPEDLNVVMNSCSQSSSLDKKLYINKGIQKNTSQKVQSEFRQISTQRILQVSDDNKRNNIDPKLKKYIHHLLEISKSGVNKLDIDVSEVPTPTSSIINVTSNIEPSLKPTFDEKVARLKSFIDDNYSLLQEIELSDKFHHSYGSKTKSSTVCSESSSAVQVSTSYNVEGSSQMQKLSDKENQPNSVFESSKRSKLNLLHPKASVKHIGLLKKNKKIANKRTQKKSENIHTLEKTNNSSKSTTFSTTINTKTTPQNIRSKNQISSDDLDSHAVSVKSNKAMEKQKHTETKQNGLIEDLQKPCESSDDMSVKSKSSKECSPQSPRNKKQFTPPSMEEQQKNIEKYVQLSAECSKRITNLSHMLEQVRKDKQMTLSSNGSPSSQDDKIDSSKDMSPRPHTDFVPILSDIPKPIDLDEQRRKQIDDLRKDFHTLSEDKNTFAPKVWEYSAPPSGIKKIIGNESQSDDGDRLDLNMESFDNSYHFDSPEKRPKPPVALIRNPIMRNGEVDTGMPHELSTIIEVDTPLTARNVSAQSKYFETSPSSNKSSLKGINSNKKRNPLFHNNAIDNGQALNTLYSSSLKPDKNNENTSQSNQEIVSNNVPKTNMVPFVSFKDFVQDHVSINEILEDTTLQKDAVVSISSASDDTLLDIIPEMLRRNLIQKPFSNHSSINASIEDLSTTADDKSLSKNVLSSIKKPSVKTAPKFSTLDSRDKNNPSISGVNTILDSSDTSSEHSIADFENALKDMGIGWAISTLRKTKETMELSSTSSSLHRNSVKESKDSRDLLAEFANITGTSVGLSTLLNELKTPEDFMSKKDLSNASLNEQLDLLTKKIAAVRFATLQNPSKSKTLKSSSKKSPVKAGEGSETKGTSRALHKGSNPNIKVNLFSEELNVSGLQGSRDKTAQRTSTPVQFIKSASQHSSSRSSSVNQVSNGLFSIDSDLSSVKNISHSEKNISTEDKEILDIPNISLKFGKLFDSK